MPKARPALILVGILGGILGLAAYFWWLASSNPKINFLSSHAPAEWILFPNVTDGALRYSVEVNATFRRSFVLENVPAAANLSIRAMRRWEMTINGVPVQPNTTFDGQWKKARLMDVAGQLRIGTNEIVVTVFNSNGPPALWLALSMGHQQIISDSNWIVQLLDSVECKAMLASSPPVLGPGNRLLVKETPLDGFRRHLIFFTCATTASAILLSVLWRLRKRQPEFFTSSNFALCAIALPALLWAVLYWNNLAGLPAKDGFDAQDHLAYIERVRSGHGLPLANEGWQMYQPPLYYLISAVGLDIFDPTTVAGKAMVVRVLNLGIGIAHLTLIFLCLRLIFPARAGMQIVGLLLATVLPAHIYISHYITNEALAAMLVTASIFLCLRIILEKRESWGIFVALGITFGAALLAKVTAVLAAPFIVAALVDVSVLRNFSRFKIWLSNVGVAAAACLVVCGWHYYRVWSHFGSPLAGNWNPAVWPSWWMDPGFRTGAYFFRFGESLAHPWFSGLNGFADGLYSTLWGDGLLGGCVAVEQRPSWNYELMAAGFILALVPALFIAVGAISAIKKFICEPGQIGLLIVGVPSAVLAALVYMNLEVPTYGEAKAFYGLIAILPVCAFGALGYDALKRLGKPVLWIITVALGVWAMNSYATFWIHNHTVANQIHLGLGARQEGRPAESLSHYSEAVRLAPHDLEAKAFLAIELTFQNRTNELKALAAQAVRDPLPDGESHLYLAEILGLDGQLDAAIAEVRQSIAAEPDNAVAHDALCAWLCERGRYAETISAGREGERVSPFNPTLHFNLGRAFTGVGDHTNALNHFRLATLWRPNWPDALDRLGLSLLALEQYTAATNVLSQALQLRPGDPNLRFHLATAFAELGEVSREIAQYREILRIDRKFLPAVESLAWRLATTPDPNLRDGAEAVQLALTADRLSGTNDTQVPRTLAAAYARAGEFEEAAATAKKALEMSERAGQTNVAALDEKLLKLYQSGQAYVDENPRKPVIPPEVELGNRQNTNGR
jgi:tetratricopeptide (TPR) repeat protein